MIATTFDFDWLMIGSGFGGSVSALRLAEKGYRVAVIERGRRCREEDLLKSTWQFGKYFWAPVLGLKGIMRMRPFRHDFTLGQNAVGCGGVVYGGALYRATPESFDDAQWRRTSSVQRKLLKRLSASSAPKTNEVCLKSRHESITDQHRLAVQQFVQYADSDYCAIPTKTTLRSMGSMRLILIQRDTWRKKL